MNLLINNKGFKSEQVPNTKHQYKIELKGSNSKEEFDLEVEIHNTSTNLPS